MKFKLIEPTSIIECIPIVKDVKMGDTHDQRYFLGSFGEYVNLIESDDTVSSKQLWELRLAYFENNMAEPIGVTGWYEYPPLDKEGVVWLSWFGIRKQYERKGYGKILLNQTIEEIQHTHKYKWLYVFTDNADTFYQKCGFERLGSIGDLIDRKYPGINNDTGFNLTEIVLKKSLIQD